MSEFISIERFGEAGIGNDDSDVFNKALREIKSGQRISLSQEKEYNINRALTMPDTSVEFSLGGVEGALSKINYTGQNGPLFDFTGSLSGVSNLEINGDLVENPLTESEGIKIDCDLSYINRLKLTNLFAAAEFTSTCSADFDDKISYKDNSFNNFGDGISARFVHSTTSTKAPGGSIWDGFVPFSSGNITDNVVGDVRTVTIDTVTVPGASRYFLTFINNPVVAGKTYMFKIKLDQGSTGSVSGPWMNWMGAAPTSGTKTLNGINIAALGAGEYGIVFVASATENADVRLGYGTGNTVTGVATMIVSSFQFSELPDGLPVENVFNGQSAAFDTVNTSTYDSSTGLMTISNGGKIAPRVNNRNIVAFSGDSFSDETRNYPYQWYIQERPNVAMYLDGATGRTLLNGAPNVPALIDGTFQASTNIRVEAPENTLPAGILSFQGGTNDMFQNNLVADMLSAVDQVLLDNANNNVYTILWTISPFGNAPGWSAQREIDALLYNDAIRLKASDTVAVYDIFADMLEPATTFNLNPAYDPGDGIHPNDTGIAIIVAAITAIIDAAQ